MGKNKKKGVKKNNSITNETLPNVSICTPTFNRRPFLPSLIKCISAQDYPHEKIEWIENNILLLKSIFKFQRIEYKEKYPNENQNSLVVSGVKFILDFNQKSQTNSINIKKKR